jgi:hypothetical protein
VSEAEGLLDGRSVEEAEAAGGGDHRVAGEWGGIACERGSGEPASEEGRGFEVGEAGLGGDQSVGNETATFEIGERGRVREELFEADVGIEGEDARGDGAHAIKGVGRAAVEAGEGAAFPGTCEGGGESAQAAVLRDSNVAGAIEAESGLIDKEKNGQAGGA